MKLALRCSVLFSALLCLSSASTVEAAKPNRPKSAKQLKSHKFVVETKGNRHTMRIEDEYGVIGKKNSGYIEYTVADWQNKKLVHIDMIKGVKKMASVGEVLKQEVLDRYPNDEIESELAFVNLKKLLKVWAKGYPHAKHETKAEVLRGAVPALKFSGFNYVITPKIDASGVKGTVMLTMTPAKKGAKGTIVVEDPVVLDHLVAVTAPKMIRKKDRPKTKKDKKAEKRANESDAKDAGKLFVKLAKDVNRKEGVDEGVLRKHLWDLMDLTCGNGGNDGSGWADKCLFTSKGSGYAVLIKKSKSTFLLTRWMDNTADDFLKEHRRDNEAAAKEAANMIKDHADDVSRKEKVDEPDLLKHLWDLMDDTCGNGGSSGSGWTKDCVFTEKSRTYVVTPKSGSKFDLDDWMDEAAEEFVEDN